MRKIIVLFSILFAIALASSGAPPEARTQYIGGGVPAETGGCNCYYYSQAQGSGTPGDLYMTNLYMAWGAVTVSQDGTATQIQVYERGGGSGNVKLALYNSSGTNIASSSAVAVSSPAGWKGAAGNISVGVTAGTYYVGFIDDGATMAWEIDTAGTNAGRSADSQNYTTGLPASLPANANPPGGQPTVRIYVD